jgi:hypothetical protein
MLATVPITDRAEEQLRERNPAGGRSIRPIWSSAMSQPPFFHEASRTVRFWVQVDAQWIGASIGKETLHYRYRPDGRDEDPMETYQSHAEDIEAAVRRRLAQGAREPVMLRESDLPVAS